MNVCLMLCLYVLYFFNIIQYSFEVIGVYGVNEMELDSWMNVYIEAFSKYWLAALFGM
jgi:hypothetical protein